MNGDGTQHTGQLQSAMGSDLGPGPVPGGSPVDAPVTNHHDVLQLIGDVERQLERLRSAQVRSAEELAHFADRGRRLDEREYSINAAAAMLTAREAQLHAMADAMHTEEVRIAERNRATEANDEALAERQRGVELRESSIESREATIAERERSAAERERSTEDRERTCDERIAELTRAVATERESLEAERAAIEQDRVALARERTAADAAGQVANARLAALTAEIATLNECLTSLQRERDELADSLARNIADSKGAQAEALAAAERNEAALMLAMTRLRDQLADAESSLTSRDAVVEGKDRTIAERDARIVDLEREIEMARQSLRTAGEKLAALAKSVADQAPQLERGAEAIAMLAEYRQRIESQERRITQLERELAAAVEAANAVPETVVDTEALASASAELEAARQEIDRLHSEVAFARQLTDEARENNRSSAAEADQAIADTQAKLTEALTFLATRKHRIDLARRLQRERKTKREAEVRTVAENAMVRVLEEERIVKKQREELRQVQEVLSATESTMMQRFARHRGGLVAAWCMIVVGVVAVGSWFAADSVMPAAAVASVDLSAKAREGETITPEADIAFQSVHRDALSDEGFREAVKRRLADRGVHALKGNAEFDRWFEGVQFDSDGPGSLRLIAEGPDGQTALIALDTLATTLANESPKLAKGKGDVPRASITGNTQVPGRISFSTLVPQQGPLDRIMAAGMLFSGVLTVGLIAGLVTFGRIAKAKRRFEDAERFGATL